MTEDGNRESEATVEFGGDWWGRYTMKRVVALSGANTTVRVQGELGARGATGTLN